MVLNADAAPSMRVEAADERFHLLPGFSGAGAGVPATPGGLDTPVRWPGRPLAELGGRTVRFRLTLTGTPSAVPRLYALCLRRG